jgi:hypothetical protein
MADVYTPKNLERLQSIVSEAVAEKAQQNTEAAGGGGRRKYPRRDFKRKLGVLFGGFYALADGIEIGEGGISIEGDVEMLGEAMIILSFQVPGSAFIAVRAEVVSSENVQSNRYRTYCSFKNIQFENKRMIRTFVSARGE